ncbi:MAG: NAD(P)H-dependent oxidoreductase subunit E [Salinivirgaceae bacterium]|nr:NAD(P)H-dependent oxidoreductase subunit E [Salinivirgaceae bacterium]
MRIQRIPFLETQKPNSEIVDLSILNPIIEKYKNKAGNLISILQKTQDVFGYISESAFIKISDDTGLELSDMYGVATFYSQFRLKPAEKGLWKKPTNINNVKTFANIPWIIFNGAPANAKYGTEKLKGTKVFALTDKFIQW